LAGVAAATSLTVSIAMLKIFGKGSENPFYKKGFPKNQPTKNKTKQK
jgi:hypothetical protein